MTLKRDDCTLIEEGGGIYHVIPPGFEAPTATVKRFKSNPFQRKWGMRPYDSPNSPWTWRQTAQEAVTAALALPTPTADT